MPTEIIRWLLAALCCCLAIAAPAQTIESVLAPGPVIQGHVKVEHECKACHSRFDRAAQDGLCVECHKDVGQDIRQRAGYHGHRDSQPSCKSCHGEHRGRNAQLAAFDTKTFDHRATDFELHDKHTTVECSKCHLPGKRWREAAGTCVGCHVKDDVHKNGLGRRCEDCHNAHSWRETNFDHDKKTRFSLAGKHAEKKCDDCHANGHYKDTPRTCIGCHKKDDDDKGHKGQYGEKCETCHGVKTWKPSNFNHDTDTKYALKDKHRSVKCATCHTGPIYRDKLGTACWDCHAKDDKHKETLGRRCVDCHTERGWKDPPGFDHAKSRFPLRGAHALAKVTCKDCHADQLYRNAPRECIGCHKKDDRHQGSLGETCVDCHTEKDWKATGFDHERTKFQLRNAHAARTVKCQDCHENHRAYRRTPTDCLSCHKRDDRHDGTLGIKCESCHDDRSWRVQRFDHSHARFTLAGRHVVVPCEQCHLSLRFREAPRDCLGCHRKDDRHKASQGPLCESCHNVRSWALWTFDHDRATKYVLEGKHRTARCEACHTQPAPRGRPTAPLPSDCLSCHRQDDAHEGRFGRRCDNCHTPQAWKQLRPGTAGRPAS
jgi:hypothetical protein